MFPNDVQALHEMIKEYYKFGKFDDSLECFIAEINTKIVSQKLEDMNIDYTSDKAPELFRLMKGVSSQTLLSQKRQQQMEDINDKYLDLLAGARQIYALTVKLLQLCESEKAVSQDNLTKITKEKANQTLLKRVKDAMLKYHRLIIVEQEDTKATALDSKDLKKLAASLKNNFEKADANPEMHKDLAAIRVTQKPLTNLDQRFDRRGFRKKKVDRQSHSSGCDECEC